MFLVSYEFMAFLAVLLILYYMVPGRFQWMVLLASSYLFYAWGGIFYLLYPLLTTVTTWFLAKAIGQITETSKAYIKSEGLKREEKKAYNSRVKKRQRRLMVLGLVINFGILAVLKYFNFLLENINAVLGAAGVEGEFIYGNWILPLGISYYTFQSMGYLIDVYYRKYEPEQNPARLALFVSFFPQMVAGPITRFDMMRESLYKSHSFCLENIKLGLWRMIWGYFQKLVIADRLGPAVTMIIHAPDTYDGIYVLLGMVGYTVWMYADFAGGMDIVLGAAQMFGIRLPENFDRPFSSKSLGEFWRRWHMTLMLWLREYIFFPVSTSRFCKKISGTASKILGRKAGMKFPVYIATMTVWFIAGIWHGASWNFVAWGLANGVVLLISQELTPLYRDFHQRFSVTASRGYACFQVLRTFLLFACLEMFEYYPFHTVFVMLRNMAAWLASPRFLEGRWEALGLKGADVGILAFGVFLMALTGVLKGREHVREIVTKKPVPVQYGVIFGLFLLVLITGVYGHGYDASQFIYNQF